MNYIDYFREICSIPHPTYFTQDISSYIVQFAIKYGLRYIQDEHNNVIIFKDASNSFYASKSPVILQAHLDMVGISSVGADMRYTPIELVEKDGVFSARNSSLGADDGIGVSFILSILSSDTIKHPSIQAVFTTDEEEGMSGVKNLNFQDLSGKYLINLDSENDDEITISCAGGVDVCLSIDFEKNHFIKFKGLRADVNLFSLTGGHSGCDIQLNRANAILCLFEIFSEISQDKDIHFVDFSCQGKRNVIAHEALLSLIYTGEDKESFERKLKMSIKKNRLKYRKTDPFYDCKITWTDNASEYALDSSNDELADILSSLYNGVIKKDQFDNVITSINWGLANFDKESFTLNFLSLARSNDDKLKEALVKRIKDNFSDEILDKNKSRVFSCKVSSSGEYPAWPKKENSALLNLAVDCYQKIFGKNCKITLTHGGLECAYFSNSLTDCDIISIGPTLSDIHSINEHFSKESSDKTFAYLIYILENWNL